MPPRLEQVHDEAVEQYFSRIDDPQWEDLNLPTRHSHGRNIESKLWLKSSWAMSWTEPRWWPKQHIISSLESLCRLQTTDEIKVNIPHRSPFITTQTFCSLSVKLYPFYNNYSRLVAAIWSLLFWWQPMTFVWEIKDSVILVWSFYLQSSVQTR